MHMYVPLALYYAVLHMRSLPHVLRSLDSIRRYSGYIFLLKLENLDRCNEVSKGRLCSLSLSFWKADYE